MRGVKNRVEVKNFQSILKNCCQHFGRSNTAKVGEGVGRSAAQKQQQETQQNQEQNSTNNNPETVRAVRRREGGGSRGGSPKAGPPRVGAPKGGAPKGGGLERWRAGWVFFSFSHLHIVFFSRKGGGPEGWGPESREKWRPRRVEAPKSAGPKISWFFFPLPPQNFVLFFLSGVFSWNFGGVLKTKTLKCARLEFSGCRVKPRRPTPPKFHEKTPERREKSEILGGPAEAGPAEAGPNQGVVRTRGWSEPGGGPNQGVVRTRGWSEPGGGPIWGELAQIGLARPKSGWPPKINNAMAQIVQGNAGGQSWSKLVPPEQKRPKSASLRLSPKSGRLVAKVGLAVAKQSWPGQTRSWPNKVVAKQGLAKVGLAKVGHSQQNQGKTAQTTT